MSNSITFLTEDEVNALFSAASGNKRDLAILRVMYHRGLRASEIALLDMQDYDRGARRLSVHRLKGSRSAQYLLTDNELKALNSWVKLRGMHPGAIFESNRGRGINRRTLHVMVRNYGRAAGIPENKCHPHILKHSCATHLLSGTKTVSAQDLGVVQDMLGHASIGNTLRYAKFTNRRREEIGEQLRGW